MAKSLSGTIHKDNPEKVYDIEIRLEGRRKV